jgi:hypothetical protein
LFLLAPATVNHLPISTKNLTQTPFTTDLSAYFDWLNKTYGISKAPNSTQLITKSPISHKNSKDKIKKSIQFLNLFFFIKEYSPCLSAPCLHNSTCVIQSEHSFQCLCSPSFIGIYCEIGKL